MPSRLDMQARALFRHKNNHTTNNKYEGTFIRLEDDRFIQLSTLSSARDDTQKSAMFIIGIYRRPLRLESV